MNVSIPEEPESRLEQYLEAIAENGGGGGGGGGEDEIEFVDLTVTNIGTDTITVTANKTPTEVGTLVSAGKEVIYRLVVAQTVPGFAAGTYLLQTVMAGSTGVIASALATPDGTVTRGYIFGQGINQATGTIYVKNLDAPTVVQTTGTSTTDVMSQKAVTDIIGNVESALNAINNGNGA
jgi:hypothetical protein